MKHKKNVSNFGCGRKGTLKQSVGKTKHFITKPKNSGIKINNRKLFSLQHQTLNILRKADKYKMKHRKNNSVDELNNLLKHNSISDEDLQILYNSKPLRNKQKKIVESTISESKSDLVEVTNNHAVSSNSNLINSEFEKNSIFDGAVSDNDSKVVFNIMKNEKSKSLEKAKNKIKIDLASLGGKKIVSSNVEKSTDLPKYKTIENTVDGTVLETDSLRIRKKLSAKRKKPKERLFQVEHNKGLDFSKSSENVVPDCVKRNKEKKLSKKDSELECSFSKAKCNTFPDLVLLHNKSRGLSNFFNESSDIVSEIDDQPCVALNAEGKKADNHNIDFYQFDRSNVLLTLLHPFSLYFVGVLDVEVLFGTVNVIGCSLNKSSGKNTLYSTRGVSYLCITTKESEVFDNSLVEILCKHNIPEEKINSLKERFNDNVVSLIIRKSNSDLLSLIWPNLVEKYSDHVFLPNVAMSKHHSPVEDLLQCTFQLYSETNTRLYKEMPNWDVIFNKLKTGIHRTILCGGKGVGKSTLLRYLINRSLSVYNKVLVLDLDPGQSEFMVPGCLSAFIITSPLLGPNFTHFQDPVRSVYFGVLEAQLTIKYYFDCLQNIIDFCHSNDEFKNIPWLVNTMGYCRGFGVFISSSVIKKVVPTLLVQIKSEFLSQNFPVLLTPDYVERNILDLSRCSSDSENIKYEIIETNSAIRKIVCGKKEKKISSADVWGLSSPSLRNIMVLSYFGKLLNSKAKNIFEAEPYVVDVNKIHLEVLNENLTREALLDAINGNLVALCRKNTEMNGIDNCFGFGIVRAINKETNELFLLTPLSKNKLCQVDSLIKGSVPLPNKLYTEPAENVTGHVPFVSMSNNILSGVVKKTFKDVTHDV